MSSNRNRGRPRGNSRINLVESSYAPPVEQKPRTYTDNRLVSQPNTKGRKKRSRDENDPGEANRSITSASQRKAETKRENWEKRREDNTMRYVTHFAELKQTALARIEYCKAAFANRCKKALLQHPCCSSSEDISTCLEAVSTNTRTVKYVSLEAVVEIPEWSDLYKCSRCNEKFLVHAYDVGCAPSAPVAPNLMYDLQLMELARHLHISLGVSIHGKHAWAESTYLYRP
jgi:hypothetical protein